MKSDVQDWIQDNYERLSEEFCEVKKRDEFYIFAEQQYWETDEERRRIAAEEEAEERELDRRRGL